MLIEDLLIVRGTAGIGKRKGVVEIVIAEEVVWVIEIRVEVVVSIVLNQLRGHDLSASLKMLVDKAECEVRGVS